MIIVYYHIRSPNVLNFNSLVPYVICFSTDYFGHCSTWASSLSNKIYDGSNKQKLLLTLSSPLFLSVCLSLSLFLIISPCLSHSFSLSLSLYISSTYSLMLFYYRWDARSIKNMPINFARPVYMILRYSARWRDWYDSTLVMTWFLYNMVNVDSPCAAKKIISQPHPCRGPAI